MEINGREIKFLRTVKATAEIAKLCPDKDISKLTVLFAKDFPTSVEVGAKIIHFLNEGYEMNKHFADRSYKPQPLEEEEILCLDNGKVSFVEKEVNTAVVRLTKSLYKKTSQFITLIFGEDITEAQAEEAREAIAVKLPDAEITVINGGQPVYYYIISVE